MNLGNAGAALLALALPMTQSTSAQPAFEVASIKRHVLAGGRGSADAPRTTVDPTLLSMLVISPGGLVEFAYDWKSSGQIDGKPLWFYREYYDVITRAGAPASGPQQRAMMQTLLAERFHLACHRETRESLVYALLAGKKLKLSPPTGQESSGINPHPIHSSRGGEIIFTYTGKKVSMTELADWLWTRFSRPVLDKTGMAERFDFTLAVTADQAMSIADFSYALAEQLGLKIESRRGPVEFLVIDHIEKPSEN